MVEEKLKEQNVELDNVLEYLDALRISGRTNMFGAGAYVKRAFRLPAGLSSKCVVYWMETFDERHP